MIAITVLLFSALMLLRHWSNPSLSVSWAITSALLLFVGLSFIFDDDISAVLKCVVYVTFGSCLIAGEWIGSKAVARTRIITALRVAAVTLQNRTQFNGVATVTLWLLPVLLLIRAYRQGNLNADALWAAWLTKNDYSDGLLLGQIQNDPGVIGLVLNSIEAQSLSFMLLAGGLVLVRSPKQFWCAWGLYTAVSMFNGSGSRTILSMIFLISVLLWLRRFRLKAGKQVLLLILGAFGGVLTLDFAVSGRFDEVRTASLQDRLQRSLKLDFAYGAKGLEFLLQSETRAAGELGRYIEFLVTLPIPRFIWPSKLNIDPNRELTEAFSGLPVEDLRVVQLFTPLGEAGHYFGWYGVLAVPFLFGFIAKITEAAWRTSAIYILLWNYTLVCVFIGMRTTFYNFYVLVVIKNLAVLSLLMLLGVFFWRHPIVGGSHSNAKRSRRAIERNTIQ